MAQRGCGRSSDDERARSSSCESTWVLNWWPCSGWMGTVITRTISSARSPVHYLSSPLIDKPFRIHARTPTTIERPARRAAQSSFALERTNAGSRATRDRGRREHRLPCREHRLRCRGARACLDGRRTTAHFETTYEVQVARAQLQIPNRRRDAPSRVR